MTSSILVATGEAPPGHDVRRLLARLTTAVFVCYLTIGIPLPVLPLYVHQTLGFNNFLVGVTIGIQFLATVLTRKQAGAVSDHQGPKRAMLKGLWISSVAGVTYIMAALLPIPVAGKLTVLLVGRLLLGMGESLLLTGCLAWGIGLAGQPRAGKVMSWTGMAVYAALAIGSPIGIGLEKLGGFRAVAMGVTLLPLFGLAIAFSVRPVLVQPTRRASFAQVLGRILGPGWALALQGVGFASIGTFISLYFVSEHWKGAGLALTAFGGAFVLVRILFGHLPDRIGGFPVAWSSFLVEIIGQVLLWKASGAGMALCGAAVTGFGCSLMFPSLGVEAVKRVAAENRGTALGAFAAFQDISYGLTGPLAGVVAGRFGYHEVFLLGAVSAVIGLGLAHPKWNRSASAEVETAWS